MPININQRWRIVSIPRNIILQRRVNRMKPDGEERRFWRNYGYYSSLKSALIAYAHVQEEAHYSPLTDEQTLNEAISSLDDFYNQLYHSMDELIENRIDATNQKYY